MIFLTVGTQFSFDRLVRTVDEWAGRNARNDVVAQIGPSDFRPRHISCQPFVSPAEFIRFTNEAELIVSHAGMGTILNALMVGKPILVMPRQARFGEHRNDHQLATARRFRELGRIMVAMDENEMDVQLDTLELPVVGERISPFASEQLLTSVRRFIEI